MDCVNPVAVQTKLHERKTCAIRAHLGSARVVPTPWCRRAKMAYNPDTMTFDLPETDTIYISGLPKSTTEATLAAHFVRLLRWLAVVVLGLSSVIVPTGFGAAGCREASA